MDCRNGQQTKTVRMQLFILIFCPIELDMLKCAHARLTIKKQWVKWPGLKSRSL